MERSVRGLAASAFAFALLLSCTSLSVPSRGNETGDPKAPVTIEEYSDFQCPYCRDYAETVEPRIFKEYVATGRVRVIYHTFGNWVSRKAEGNTESLRTAEAAHFAADHGRFWQMHDALLRMQGRPNSGVFSDDAIVAAAGRAGLDGEKLRAALAAGVYADRVQKEYDEGIARGVTSTPTFFVNGRMIVGAQPYEVFKKAIEDAR